MFLHVLGRRRGADSYGGEIVNLPSGVLEMSDSASGATGRGGGARTTSRTERIAADTAVGHGRHVHVMVLSIHDAFIHLKYSGQGLASLSSQHIALCGISNELLQLRWDTAMCLSEMRGWPHREDAEDRHFLSS